ncbi:MAG: serine/threonine-protein kinase [Gemmataceae bacterium]
MTSEHARAGQLEGGVRIGDFEIEKRLGAGGMGIVYQARQISLNRRVALKVLGPALNQGSNIARFQREAQAVARLKHPGIATLHFIGQDAEVCYHVMELVEGIPLRRVIERLAETREGEAGPDSVVSAEVTPSPDAPSVRFDQLTTAALDAPPAADADPLSPAAKQMRHSPQYIRRCVGIVLDVAKALAYAHGEGVVHRDIKPENLMLDPKGQVHVIDFGLARFFDDVSITNTGQLVGTPLYMSPEQVTGRIQVDLRTDVYSLGIVLYELLTLRRPIEFTSRENLLRNIVTRAIPPLCARNRAVPSALEAVAHKATHKDPEERYQSAAEMAADLQLFLDGKPVSAPPYRYRLDVRETVGNRPGQVVLSAFLCFLVGSGVFVTVLAMATMMAFVTNGNLAGLRTAGIQALLGASVFAISSLLGYGLLAGWNWARWVVVVLAAGVALLCLAGCVALAFTAVSTANAVAAQQAEKNQAKGKADPAKVQEVTMGNMMVGMFAMYSVPLMLVLACAATSFVSLLLPSTAAWFRMAGQARREHRALLAALGD